MKRALQSSSSSSSSSQQAELGWLRDIASVGEKSAKLHRVLDILLHHVGGVHAGQCMYGQHFLYVYVLHLHLNINGVGKDVMDDNSASSVDGQVCVDVDCKILVQPFIVGPSSRAMSVFAKHNLD